MARTALRIAAARAAAASFGVMLDFKSFIATGATLRLESLPAPAPEFDHAMARVATDVHTTRPQMDWLTMTNTTTAGPTLRAWARLQSSAFGRWMFGRTVARRAPYFGTIKPKFLDLQPKLCRVSMRKRRAVENHLGTVHALAMGNLCELAAGMCTEVTIPVGMRWIPRGMTIEYL